MSIAHDRDYRTPIHPWTKVKLPPTAVRMRTDVDNQDDGKPPLLRTTARTEPLETLRASLSHVELWCQPRLVVALPSTNTELGIGYLLRGTILSAFGKETHRHS